MKNKALTIIDPLNAYFDHTSPTVTRVTDHVSPLLSVSYELTAFGWEWDVDVPHQYGILDSRTSTEGLRATRIQAMRQAARNLRDCAIRLEMYADKIEGGGGTDANALAAPAQEDAPGEEAGK